jgi:SHS2 domain-containing protein
MTRRHLPISSAALAAALISLTAAASEVPVQAQQPSRQELLDRATAYVLSFVDRFTNVVAEETYRQETTRPKASRILRSDLALVRFPGATTWMMLRDVYEVDGKSVRDASQEQRILRLFTETPRTAVGRAREIADAGTRFNLVDIGNTNNPLAVLAFLQPEYRARFRFNLAGIEKKLGPMVRTVRFVEFQRPTILKQGANSDLFSRGLIWIEEQTGRVVKTELQLGSQMEPIRITTTYRFDEDLQLNVPIEMQDWYPDGGGEIRGLATYGKFRRFQVQTEESAATQKQP